MWKARQLGCAAVAFLVVCSASEIASAVPGAAAQTSVSKTSAGKVIRTLRPRHLRSGVILTDAYLAQRSAQEFTLEQRSLQPTTRAAATRTRSSALSGTASGNMPPQVLDTTRGQILLSGANVSVSTVHLLGRGADQFITAQARTREYFYTYDLKSGNLLSRRVRLAPAALAASHGFPADQVR
jgi:hypothetical protein